MALDEQRRLILDQFTRQAVPFSEMHARDDAEIHRLLIDTAGIGAGTRSSTWPAGRAWSPARSRRSARHVTGIDLTPAMIEQARARQRPRAGQPDLGRGRRPAPCRSPTRRSPASSPATRSTTSPTPGRVRGDGPRLPARRPSHRRPTCSPPPPSRPRPTTGWSSTATRRTPTPCNWPSWSPVRRAD